MVRLISASLPGDRYWNPAASGSNEMQRVAPPGAAAPAEVWCYPLVETRRPSAYPGSEDWLPWHTLGKAQACATSEVFLISELEALNHPIDRLA